MDTVVLIGDVDDLEQPRRTGKRRRAATNSSTANDDKKYIRSVGHTVREITDFCTQMDHLETLPKGASDVSDLHASTLIQQVRLSNILSFFPFFFLINYKYITK